MKQKGFTLIELLVVIAIIGLLASVVLVALNDTRIKARNARRLADIKQVVTAFNLALDSGPIPNNGGPNACLSTTCYGGWSSQTANAAIDAYLDPYIKKPSDPPDSTRPYGGYLYMPNWPGGLNPYDGSIFTVGNYLNWFVEFPVSSTSCGVGRIWNITEGAVQCLYKFD
jgi:prepilin-type N-terminal cleavage/methylation domain-containing protein